MSLAHQPDKCYIRAFISECVVFVFQPLLSNSIHLEVALSTGDMGQQHGKVNVDGTNDKTAMDNGRGGRNAWEARAVKSFLLLMKLSQICLPYCAIFSNILEHVWYRIHRTGNRTRAIITINAVNIIFVR